MKVAILGYGKSGKASEIILRNRGADVIEVFDDSLYGVKNILDLDSKDFNLIVVSPGIDCKKYPMIDRDKVISEIDLAYSLINDPEKIIVVTGTNGKSTTAYLLEQILHAFSRDAVLCGNIGKPFTDVVDKERHDYYVVELSSFQIELLKLFKAKRLIITNIDLDHLDRYENFNNYIEAKLKVVNRIEDKGL
ncbi:MAG: Mur ligase family protein, partial [Deferribacterota bacterium]|nr:Mur ligase family protein [Deferribacterota bacterium]